MLELKLIKSPDSQGSHEIFGIPDGKTTLLGRGENCQIRLASAGISKKHCVITPISSTRVEVEDLGSSNGTYINGLLVKKHIMQPGDTLSVHNYVLQLSKQAPEVVETAPDTHFNTDFSTESDAIEAEGVHKQEGFGEKFQQWLEDAIYPNADQLAEKIDVRLLCFLALSIWTIIVTSLSLNPFKEIANVRAREESIEVAKLYTRQLVKLNQRAIIEQRYQDLMGDLDDIRGQTPGVLETMIVDVVNGQILAPPERLGQGVPNSPEYFGAKLAIGRDVAHVELDEEMGIAWVSAPIKIGTSSGDKTIATALVEYSYVDGQFTIGNLIDQIVNSLVYALALSLLFLIFIYRWLNGNLTRLSRATESALRKNENAVDLKVEWPAFQALSQEINFCLTKAAEGDPETGGGTSSDWAAAAAQNSTSAAAAFDENMKITAWTPEMEKISGVQESLALHADISEASRDVALESAVQELANEAMIMPWNPQSREIEFSGRRYLISMVAGGGAYLLNIDEEIES